MTMTNNYANIVIMTMFLFKNIFFIICYQSLNINIQMKLCEFHYHIFNIIISTRLLFKKGNQETLTSKNAKEEINENRFVSKKKGHY